MVKNPPANAGEADSITGSGRSPKKEMATHSNILAWEIPRTEEPGGLHIIHGVAKESDMTKQLNNNSCFLTVGFFFFFNAKLSPADYLQVPSVVCIPSFCICGLNQPWID